MALLRPLAQLQLPPLHCRLLALHSLPLPGGLRQVSATLLVCCSALYSLLECPTMPQVTSNLKLKVQTPAKRSCVLKLHR